jgi:hypothetical protein
MHSVPIALINEAFETSDKSDRGNPMVHLALRPPAESLQHWDEQMMQLYKSQANFMRWNRLVMLLHLCMNGLMTLLRDQEHACKP